MNDNKKILDQVKNAVSSKKLNEKKPKNDYRDKDNSNETKKIGFNSKEVFFVYITFHKYLLNI